MACFAFLARGKNACSLCNDHFVSGSCELFKKAMEEGIIDVELCVNLLLASTGKNAGNMIYSR
jgi:hypothetical protein